MEIKNSDHKDRSKGCSQGVRLSVGWIVTHPTLPWGNLAGGVLPVDLVVILLHRGGGVSPGNNLGELCFGSLAKRGHGSSRLYPYSLNASDKSSL